MAILDTKATTTIDTTSYSKLNAKFAKLDNSLNDAKSDLNTWRARLSYHQDLIKQCDNVINAKGFHPILKTKARLAKLAELPRKKEAQIKVKMLEAKTKSLRLQHNMANVNKAIESHRLENRFNITKNGIIQVKNGKVDFSKGNAKMLANKPMFDENGNPTPEFEQLKQIIANHPQSITTLPDNVIESLNNQKVKVKVGGAAMYDKDGNFKGKTPGVEEEKTAFEYLGGVASAGFKIAERQGRTAQANDETKTKFADWLKEKEEMLKKQKSH